MLVVIGMEQFEEIGKVGLTLLMTVSARGSGFYLYIPKGVCDTFGIRVGDRLEVQIGKIRRLKTVKQEAEKVEA